MNSRMNDLFSYQTGCSEMFLQDDCHDFLLALYGSTLGKGLLCEPTEVHTLELGV